MATKKVGDSWLTGYLGNALKLEKRKEVIDTLEACIISSGLQFDAIAFTGLSGALIAPPLADRLNKPLIAVRKEKASHSHRLVEGYIHGDSYLIVDDVVSTGDTVRRIYEALKKESAFSHYEPRGVFCYNSLVTSKTRKVAGPSTFVQYPAPGVAIAQGKAPIKIHLYTAGV